MHKHVDKHYLDYELMVVCFIPFSLLPVSRRLPVWVEIVLSLPPGRRIRI